MARNQDRCVTLGFKLRLNQSIQNGLVEPDTRVAILRSLRDKTEQWLYFLDHPEVPPDNQAERSLRLAVTKRKVGSRSMDRFAETADLLSVVQTCRRQGRSVLTFREALMLG